jgi:hypothetical protein
LVCVAAFAALAAPAHAAVVPDQSAPVVEEVAISLQGPVAQTFTAGVDGWLVSVGVAADCAQSRISMWVLGTTGGEPSGEVLGAGRALVPAWFRSPPGLASVPLDRPVRVTRGARYAFVVSWSSSICRLYGSTTDSYAGGSLFSYDGTSWHAGAGDLGFGTLVDDDVTAPAVTITDGPAGPTRSTEGTFQFRVAEPLPLECKLDTDATWSACTSPYRAGSIAEGTRSFSVRATDAVGNVGLATHTWTIDLTPPTIAVPADFTLESPNGQTVGAAVTVSSSDANGLSDDLVDCSSDRSNGGALHTGVPELFYFELGVNVVTCRDLDRALNEGTAMFRVTVTDVTAPTLVWTSYPSPDYPTNSTTAQFGWMASENATLECRLDTGTSWLPCPAYVTITGVAEGRRTFSVRPTDPSGNVGATVSTSWTIDLTPPGITVPADFTLESPNGEGLAGPALTLIASDEVGLQSDEIGCVSDRNSGMTFRSGVPGTGWFALGVNVVTCVVYDRASNRGTATFTVTVTDTTGPTLTFTSYPSPDYPTNSTTAQFGWMASEHATYKCRVDTDASWLPCPPFVNVTGVSEGRRTFSVRPTDTSGNLGAAVSTSWTVDLTPPTIAVPADFTLESPKGEALTGPSLTLTASDEVGLQSDTISCVSDRNSGMTFRSGVPGTGWFDLGVNVVTCVVYDRASNRGTATFTVTVTDTTGPTLTFTSYPSPDYPTNSTTAQFGWMASEHATYKCRVDTDASWLPCPPFVNVTGVSEGRRTFSVRPTDTSGNLGAAVSTSWTVDLTPPTIAVPADFTLESPKGEALTGPSLTLTASDEVGLQSDTISCVSDRNSGMTFRSGVPGTGWFDLGVNVVTCVVYDRASNRGTSVFTVTVTDTTGPTVVFTTRPANPSADTWAQFGWSVSENATVECRLDGGDYAACAGYAYYPGPLADGPHTFEIHAVDRAGNSSITPLPWSINTNTVGRWAGPGVPVTTDPQGMGPTPASPLEVSVTTPNVGYVTIAERPAATPPAGWTFLGRQVAITAPTQTGADRLTIAFDVDASLVPAGGAAVIEVWKNGALVADCLATDTPDPCVSSRAVLAGADARLVVRTSTASVWGLGVHKPYAFSGFGLPVRDGRAVAVAGLPYAVHFGLGGDAGLRIFLPASPRLRPCGGGDALSAQGTLVYEKTSKRYVYAFATRREWSGSCRELVLGLLDGSGAGVQIDLR